jgi:hypothetical protein
MLTSRESYVAVADVNKKGIRVRKIIDEQELDENRAKAESGEEQYEVLDGGPQSFIFYGPESDSDFKELVPSEKEQVNLENRALRLKQQQSVRTLMGSGKPIEGEAAFEPAYQVEGDYDLRAACAEETERRISDPVGKLLKGLSDTPELTPEQLAAFEAWFTQRKQASLAASA